MREELWVRLFEHLFLRWIIDWRLKKLCQEASDSALDKYHRSQSEDFARNACAAIF